MKVALAVALALMIACLISSAWAQSMSGFKNVGGDSGRDALKSLNAGAAASRSVENNSSSNASSNNSSTGAGSANGLWNWGNAPKGSILVDGKLADDPLNSLNSLNTTDGSIKAVGVDTYTGRTIYSYKIPKTGEVKYFYIDPLTQERVYTDSPNIEAEPANVTEKPYTLPAIFR